MIIILTHKKKKNVKNNRNQLCSSVSNSIFFCLLILLGTTFACSQKEPDIIDLSGKWTYQLDSLEKGEAEKWFTQDFSQTLELPGALRNYGIGNEPDLKTKWTGSIYDSSWYFNPALAKYRTSGNMKFPFWLTPVKHYVGMAWFQKEIVIPENWTSKDLILFLERPHWQTSVWLDNQKIVNDNSLSTPHRFVIPAGKITKGKHRLTIRVDNAIRDIDPGINSHSISDHTQGNWNGITGKMLLYAKNQMRIDVVKILPDLKNDKVHSKICFSGMPKSADIKVRVEIKDATGQQAISPITTTLTADSIALQIPMGKTYKTWSEFAPNLYQMTVTLVDKHGAIDKKTETFGMREFRTKNKHFEINGIPTFLRGTTECCVFPHTGYPPTDEAEWAHIFDVCKSFGLNHMRFHSYCPPEAAFTAADKAGFYLQVEGPSWAKYSTSLGYGKPIDAYLMKETKRIIDTYGNHPSFCMMAYGNEPSGRYVTYLENWVDHFRKYDPQRVFTGASTGRSWKIIENSDYLDRAAPRGLAWKNKQPESQFDYRNKTENQQRPYVTFEMGQWCVFPNFGEIKKYTGALKAKNFEIFQEELSDNHMGDLANDFLMASGKLQASCYKQEIEATLRTPNLAGFQLLSLNDFPGQGTALVGVLDAFWDEKGYISASEFKEFCNVVVPLVRLPKFTFQSNETLKAPIEIANFSGKAITNLPVSWELVKDSGTVVCKTVFKKKTITVGHCNEIGNIETDFSFVKKATKYTLNVSVGEYKNHWNIWVYPSEEKQIKTDNILIAHNADEKVKQALDAGKTVLLLAAGNVENSKDVVQYQVPAFWNTSWFRMRPPHTTGILINDKHAVFDDFPTDYYSDLQWWEICNRQQVMNLKNFPKDFRPIVQPIDTWFLNRRLAMLFEAKIGKGKLMVCSMDLTSNLNNRPVAKQLKQSILEYINSEKFNPESTVDWSVIQELFEKKERQGWNSYVNENP